MLQQQNKKKYQFLNFTVHSKLKVETTSPESFTPTEFIRLDFLKETFLPSTVTMPKKG